MTYMEMYDELRKGGNVLVTLEEQQGLFSYCLKASQTVDWRQDKFCVDWRQEKVGDLYSIWSA
jgi:hypothetical protein|tara:strand:+ start:462 stop:650 length:189 start_codon:yes stop_codon:yes gene_type:complete